MRRFSMVSIALVSLAMIASACASSRQGAAGAAASAMTDSGTADSGAAESDQSRLRADEIEAAGLPNAYELVSRLRRPWLRGDPLTGGEVAVYMDERALGGAETLRDIPSVDVAELRYVSNEDAMKRWGTSIEGSVIVVVRRM